MREITGEAKTIRQMLSGQRYSIDYYQREYRWARKQVRELVHDLSENFLDSYQDGHERSAVQKYGHYFLGSVILSNRDDKTFIVDGQQRLTTLTLLLIFLYHQQGKRDDRVKLEDLIFAEKYGARTFNIDVSERSAALEALFKGDDFDPNGSSESVHNIVTRFEELEDLFPQEIDEKALPYFVDWLIENVHLVAITTSSDEDAYTVFETMNDRGLSLSPLDMLKGYLLANISDSNKRDQAAKVWRERIDSLRALGKDEDSDAVKAWLRARYAKSVRERRTGSENKDFERIGSEFHRWVGEHASEIGLKSGEDYFQFIHREMNFYTRQYERIRVASNTLTDGLESVYYVARFFFTLQYPVLLAPLNLNDSQDVVDRKLRTVANFLDIALARRAVNYLSMTYGSMSYAMFLVMRDIRGKELGELPAILQKRLDDYGCDFNGTSDGQRSGFSGFALNNWSKRYIKVLLARMTEHLELKSGESSHLEKYLAEGKVRYEVEHIWADKYDRHKDEFNNKYEFSEYRNRVGGLLLLPKKFNASYGDLTYPKKLKHYISQNLLAKSLHEQCYKHNPGFLSYISNSGLPIKAHPEFKKADIDERQSLYQNIAEEIWDVARLSEEVTA